MLDETNLKNNDKSMIKKVAITIILYIVNIFYQISTKCFKIFTKKDKVSNYISFNYSQIFYFQNRNQYFFNEQNCDL